MKEAKIGLIQVQIQNGKTVQEKQDMLYSLGENCLKEGADLIFFPEAFQYTEYRQILKNDEELKAVSSAWKERCSALAKKYHAYVVPWDYYCDENGEKYNSSYILDRNGIEIGRYKKCNLTYKELEKSHITRGEEYPVFDLDIGKVGIMICFDNYFPEVSSILGAKGANLILYPLFGDTLLPQWDLKVKARAIDNSLFVAPCQIDKHYHIAYTGLINPKGEVVEKLTSPNSYSVVTIDMEEQFITHTTGIPEYKEDLRSYLHKCRNFSSYGDIVKQGAPTKEWDEIFFGNIPK